MDTTQRTDGATAMRAYERTTLRGPPRDGLKATHEVRRRTRGMTGCTGSAEPASGRSRRPAAACAPRTTAGSTCGHASAPPAAPWPRAKAGGGPCRRISASGRPTAGRRARMTRAHDRQNTLPQRRRTSCMNTPRASCSLLAPISCHCVRARASAASPFTREGVHRLTAAPNGEHLQLVAPAPSATTALPDR